MAPSTRLRAEPERRVNYRRTALHDQTGSSRNPVVLEDTPPPQSPAAPPAKTKGKAATKPTRDASGRFIKPGSTAKPKADGKRVVKVPARPKPKKKARPDKTECVICTTTKNTKRSFTAPEDEKTCQHFENVCNLCVSKQIKTKMAARQLTDAHLPCMFPGCEAVLDHTALKKAMTKALFQSWDQAVTKHLLAADPSYMACLNAQCGHYFSTEDCGSAQQKSRRKPKPGSKSKQEQDEAVKAVCPWCDHEMCLSCNRPWHSGSCNSAKRREDQASEKAIKKLGAKPCPQCGVNIEKHGGCDHMNCQRCRHNFCWECLGTYDGNVNNHAESCSHRRPLIAHDIGNFVADNLTVDQVNQLIDRARQDRNAGRVPRPNLQLVNGARLANGQVVMPGQLPNLPPEPRPAVPVPVRRVRRMPHGHPSRAHGGGDDADQEDLRRAVADDDALVEQQAAQPTPALAPPQAPAVALAGATALMQALHNVLGFNG